MKLSDEHFEQLTAYLDGELNDQERREVDALLAREPQAAALLESLRQVSNSVAALPRESAPSGLSAAVQERMARKSLLDGESLSQQELPRLVIWTNRLAVAACLALVCTAGWLGIQGRGTRGPAVALKGNNRAITATTGDHPKESTNEALAFNTPRSTPPPVSPAAAIGGRIESTTTPSIDGTLVAYRDAGELERKLNKTGVSKSDIQQADLSSISNQMVIETEDPEARDTIVRVVADFARKKGIPDVNSKLLPEPVQAQQCFFVVSPPQNKQTAGQDSEETWIGVNAPIKTAHELMDCVNKVGSQKKAPVQVEMNGCKPVTPNQATQILAANAARNQMLQVTRGGGAEPVPAVSPPPPAAGMLADASTGRASKSADLTDDEAVRAERQAAIPPGKSKDGGSRTNEPSDSAEAKKDEPKPAAVSAEGASRVDSDNESNSKREFQGGRGGTDSPARGGLAKDVRSRDEKFGASRPASAAVVSSPVPATPRADGCVTLSICVRNPAVQRARVDSSAASQPSDTIRQSGATSMPQTSMPAAGAHP